MFDIIPPFAFVVDTENYAGNFERELCGYVTGIVGQCEVGLDQANEFINENQGENPFEEIILQVPDEHGCCRPVSIWSTPGWFNNGVGGNFKDGEFTVAEEHYRKHCLKQAKNKPYTSKDANQRDQKEWLTRAKKSLVKYPSYQSVAIFFSKKPNENMLEILKRRAHIFCEGRKVILIGFRLLELSLKVKEKVLI